MTWFGDEVTLKDGPQLDAFGRLRTSDSYTVFDAQQEYGLDTLRTWDATANGSLATGSSNGSVTSGSNAVGPININTRMCPITVSTTNGHYSILQSRQYTRYIPGKSHLVFITGIFAPDTGYSASIVRRTSTSGSVVDSSVAQASWNIDMFDGTGPSGITLDFTKTQIMVIQAQWLGVGRVVVGFDVDGCLFPAHQFLNANSLTVPYTQTFNLPVRLEVRNTSTTTTVSRTGYFDSTNGIFLELSKTAGSAPGGSTQFVCCSVQSEGGTTSRGFPVSAGNGVTTIGVTSRRPILSIRPKTTFNSRTNRGHIELEDVFLSSTSSSCYWELIVGGTLTGASFASVSTDSATEFDVAATAISGGLTIISGVCASGGGSTRAATVGNVDFRNPLVLSQIDALTATQTNVSIVCTSFSGTSNVASGINWHEQVI